MNKNPSGKGQNGWIYSSNGYCPTLTTNKGEGIKVYVPQWNKIIKLRPIDYAKLQGFPLDYQINKSLSNNKQYNLFGNSISIPVVKTLAEKLYDFLPLIYGQI